MIRSQMVATRAPLAAENGLVAGGHALEADAAPGAFTGRCAARETFGRLPLAQVLEAAIEIKGGSRDQIIRLETELDHNGSVPS